MTSRRPSRGSPRASSGATASRPCSGITGSGKSATIAWLIEKVQRPTLVLAPNKALAAQLANEFRQFFPDNRVEYFVSYYDYYQPEAYIPQTDTYIEKDASINDEIDRLRHSATAGLLTRRDVIIVASVSAIYGLGSPEQYQGQLLRLVRGVEYPLGDAVRRLVDIQYERNEVNLTRGRFRLRGDTLEVFPAYEETIARVEYFGDEVDRILRMNPVTGEVLEELSELLVYPATHYVTARERMVQAMDGIEEELADRLADLEEQGKAARGAAAADAHRLRPGDDARGGLLQRHRELQPPHRRAGRRGAAVHPARLLPQGLPHGGRREPRHHPAAARPVRGRPQPQGGAGRARLPAALGGGQPAAPLRRVAGEDRTGGVPLGHPGHLENWSTPPRWWSRSSGPPAWWTPRWW